MHTVPSTSLRILQSQLSQAVFSACRRQGRANVYLRLFRLVYLHSLDLPCTFIRFVIRIHNFTVLLVGPEGRGKTTLLKSFIKQHNRDHTFCYYDFQVNANHNFQVCILALQLRLYNIIGYADAMVIIANISESSTQGRRACALHLCLRQRY